MVGCFMALDRQLLSDPVVRATMGERRYLVGPCWAAFSQCRCATKRRLDF